MKFARLTAVILLLGLSAMAQQSCPVAVLKVDPRAKPVGAAILTRKSQDRWNSYLQIEYINNSDKKLAVVRFGAAFIDAMNEAKESRYDYESEDNAKPGQTKKPFWGDGKIASKYSSSMHAVAWLEKAMFSDGTYWIDDGSRSCSNIEVQSTHALGGAPAETMSSLTSVTSVPSGADVSVDGRVIGKTPYMFNLLKKGDAERIVTISLKGYKTVERKFLPTGAPIKIELTLVEDKLPAY